MTHAYPRHLAAFVMERWSEVAPSRVRAGARGSSGHLALPQEDVLLRFISVCYQASLMHEEERTVTFRVILINPEELPQESGPPTGLHRLVFTEPRPFDEDELRRLSPAADYHRSLIGVKDDGDGSMSVWGIVQSGPRWVLRTQGGRELSPPLPGVPVLHVSGPGRVEFRRGSRYVAKLEGGELHGRPIDVFASKWLTESFAPVRAELAELHASARELTRRKTEEPWAPLDPDLTRMIGQHVVRRMISVLRDVRHGGTLIFIPAERTGEFSRDNPYITFKHRFRDEEPRRRYRSLILGVTNRLVEVHGKGGRDSYPRAVGWHEYQTSSDPQIARLDEAVFELANLIAALAAVDGAVVLSKRYELLGFGAEISASLERTQTVRRALDHEGRQTVEEPVDGVGTRHRSAYRIAAAVPGAIAVVVSQDGSARFITKGPEGITYWNQA
ncbi:putative sensor domain DACNV-containing protein [Rubrobacter indicoceani]|uniref:putative sensor domain DACNV-containing protein n=1 Tax=Rubrobacter indicoceani TaxID=2051957 RepID=UPI000E5B3081|nr:diadenylate cyclase [Rubrobacter indicoceani]